MTSENHSSSHLNLTQRMERLQALMAKSAISQSSLCGSGSSTARKWQAMLKSAHSREQILQGIATSDEGSATALASILLLLRKSETSTSTSAASPPPSYPMNLKRRSSDPGLRTKVRKASQSTRRERGSLNAHHLKLLVERYQRDMRIGAALENPAQQPPAKRQVVTTQQA
jgi:hypothetical protein